MKIIGHRGAAGRAPENTIRSIRKAIDLGVDAVEFDVFVLPSGEAVLMHDDVIDRTTNGRGSLLSHSFDHLRSLDAGDGERIPTLHEVLDAVNGEVPVNIELKGFGAHGPVANIIAEYLGRGWASDRFIVSSFNHHDLRDFKRLMPHIDIVALIYALPLSYAAYAEELGAVAAAPATDHLTQEFVDDAHNRGLEVYAWIWEPVDEVETLRLHAIGVDAVFSDYPDFTRRVLQEKLAQPAVTSFS